MWYSNFRAGGKRVRKALSTNKRTAQAMLDDMVASIRAHKNGIVPHHMSWGAFEGRYLQYCETDKKRSSANRDKLAIRLMKEAFPIIRLADVTPELLQRLKFRWKENEKTTQSITRNIKAIKAAMRKAEEWGYIQRQNWNSVKVKEAEGRLLYYAVDELQNLITQAQGPYKIAIIIMSRSGMRSGEVYHLRWENVRFDLRKIHVVGKPCDQKCPGCESGQWSPKCDKERWVPMSKDLEAYLHALPRTSRFILGADCPTMTPWLEQFRKVLRNAKLAGSPHTLRHTFASHLAIAGVSMKKIADLLGHATVRMAEKYSHLSPESLENAIDQLPKVAL